MPRRILQGRVVSTKSDKTAVVSVERKFKHPLYLKTVKVSKKYHAHDEHNSSKEGDMIWIMECRPISKNKRWEICSK